MFIGFVEKYVIFDYFISVTAPAKSNNSDLVIEDSHEGETLLGDGKSGVLQMEDEEDQLPTRTVQNRPRSTAKPRSLGMFGPITNTEVWI